MSKSSMPMGVYRVDAAGFVRAHVSVSAGAAGSSEAVGRHFFEDIAPCTNCAAFRGRVEALLLRGGGSETFMFRLRFPWITADVEVRLVSSGANAVWILLAHLGAAQRFASDMHELPLAS